MIDILALVFSAAALVAVAILLHRDAKRADVAGLPEVGKSSAAKLFNRIEALVKRHEYSKEPGHRTSLATVKDIIEAAERESAKPRIIK